MLASANSMLARCLSLLTIVTYLALRVITSVLRTTPCLFGLFSVVALMFAQLYRKHPTPARAAPGYAKPEPTFVDALAAVRRELWSEFLKPPALPRPWQNPPPPVLDTLLDRLCYAA